MSFKRSLKHSPHHSAHSSLHGSRQSIQGQDRLSATSDYIKSNGGSSVRLSHEESMREQALQEDTKHAALDKDYKQGLMDAFGPQSSNIFEKFEDVRQQQQELASKFWRLENDFSKQRQFPLAPDKSMSRRTSGVFNDFETEAAGKELRRSLADLQQNLYSLADQISSAQAPLFPFRNRDFPSPNHAVAVSTATQQMKSTPTVVDEPVSAFQAKEKVRKQHQYDQQLQQQQHHEIQQKQAQPPSEYLLSKKTDRKETQKDAFGAASLNNQTTNNHKISSSSSTVVPLFETPSSTTLLSSSLTQHTNSKNNNSNNNSKSSTRSKTPSSLARTNNVEQRVSPKTQKADIILGNYDENSSDKLQTSSMNVDGITPLDQVRELFKNSPARVDVETQHGNNNNNNADRYTIKPDTRININSDGDDDEGDDDDVWGKGSGLSALERLVLDTPMDTTTI
eukprot:m.11897 g.11897  ORF g.11897 m.11897 type:complete len:452 (-) comp3915_c0_seq1:195-1550(-)